MYHHHFNVSNKVHSYGRISENPWLCYLTYCDVQCLSLLSWYDYTHWFPLFWLKCYHVMQRGGSFAFRPEKNMLNYTLIPCGEKSAWWRNGIEAISALLVLYEKIPFGEAGGFLHKRSTMRGIWTFSLVSALTRCWTNSQVAADLRRDCAHVASL